MSDIETVQDGPSEAVEALAAQAGLEEVEAQNIDEVEQGPTPEQIEAEAREMGWRPEDEFHGNPDDWRPAEEFVKRGKELLPIVRSQLKKSEAKLADQQRRYEQLESSHKKDFARLERMGKIAMDRQREMLTKEFSDRKRAAVEFADTDAYSAAEAEEREALKNFDEKNKIDDAKDEDTDDGPPNDPAIQQFAEANKHWFGEGGNKALTLRALAEFAEIEQDHPAMAVADQLELMRTRTMEKNPAAFGVKPKLKAADVMDGTRTSRSSSNSLSRKLPPEAKAQAEKDVAEGLFESIDEYAKLYFDGQE